MGQIIIVRGMESVNEINPMLSGFLPEHEYPMSSVDVQKSHIMPSYLRALAQESLPMSEALGVRGVAFRLPEKGAGEATGVCGSSRSSSSLSVSLTPSPNVSQMN